MRGLYKDQATLMILSSRTARLPPRSSDPQHCNISVSPHRRHTSTIPQPHSDACSMLHISLCEHQQKQQPRSRELRAFATNSRTLSSCCRSCRSPHPHFCPTRRCASPANTEWRC